MLFYVGIYFSCFHYADNLSRELPWGALDDVVMGGVSESMFQVDPTGGENGGPTGLFKGLFLSCPSSLSLYFHVEEYHIWLNQWNYGSYISIFVCFYLFIIFIVSLFQALFPLQIMVALLVLELG